VGGGASNRTLSTSQTWEDRVNPYAPKFDPEDPKGETLIVPVFFLCPEHATSDLVPEFFEDTTFGAHLAPMSPPGKLLATAAVGRG
jgi:hypothetical protein